MLLLATLALCESVAAVRFEEADRGEADANHGQAAGSALMLVTRVDSAGVALFEGGDSVTAFGADRGGKLGAGARVNEADIGQAAVSVHGQAADASTHTTAAEVLIETHAANGAGKSNRKTCLSEVCCEEAGTQWFGPKSWTWRTSEADKKRVSACNGDDSTGAVFGCKWTVAEGSHSGTCVMDRNKRQGKALEHGPMYEPRSVITNPRVGAEAVQQCTDETCCNLINESPYAVKASCQSVTNCIYSFWGGCKISEMSSVTSTVAFGGCLKNGGFQHNEPARKKCCNNLGKSDCERAQGCDYSWHMVYYNCQPKTD